MRELTDHKSNAANGELKISVLDEPGQGGASHLYSIEGFNTEKNASDPFVERYGKPSDHTTILFQNGPIKEFGVNGVTHEALLAIIIDRLRSFQAGPYACRENEFALVYCESALRVFLARTNKRLARGVEGTNQV